MSTINSAPIGPDDKFILIHGTFAHDADWISPKSQFAEALVRHFPSVHVDTFRWSGDNSHSARIAAGLSLSERIDKIAGDLPPNAGIHLVGHSHGGNVALYALDRAHYSDKIKSLAFLGTPFLHLEANSLETGLRFWTSITKYIAAFFLWFFFTVFLFNLDVLEGGNQVFAMLFAGMAIFQSVIDGDGLGSRLFNKLSLRLREQIVSNGEAFAKRIRQSVPRQRVFIAYTDRDEARLLLKFGSYAGSLPAQFFPIIRTILFPVLGTAFACHVGLGEISNHVSMRSTNPDSLSAMQDPLGFMSLTINLVCLIFLLPIGIFLGNIFFRSNPFSFGWEHPWSALAFRLHPRVVPKWAIGERTTLFRSEVSGMSGLRHSAFYKDPSTIDALLAWLSGKELSHPDHLAFDKVFTLTWNKRDLIWFAVLSTLIYSIANAVINVRFA